MRILFDSRQTQYKTPFGTLRTGECCVLQIRIPTEVGASGVRLMLEDSEHAVCAELPFSFASRGEDGYELWRLEFTRQETGLHFYWFRIDKRGGGSFRLFRQGRDTNMEAGVAAQRHSRRFPGTGLCAGRCDVSDLPGPLRPQRELRPDL